MGPSLEVLAIQAEQIRQQVRTLQDHAREAFVGDDIRQRVNREMVVGECYAIDTLIGQVGAAFRNAARRESKERCAHSACVQHWIETGDAACVHGSAISPSAGVIAQVTR